MTPTSSHPYVELIGPPIAIPKPNSVRHPDRIEMIVNETAKFVNPLIPRLSSCAYPSSWSRSTSDFDASVPGEAPPMPVPASPICNSFPLKRRCVRLGRIRSGASLHVKPQVGGVMGKPD